MRPRLDFDFLPHVTAKHIIHNYFVRYSLGPPHQQHSTNPLYSQEIVSYLPLIPDSLSTLVARLKLGVQKIFEDLRGLLAGWGGFVNINNQIIHA